MRFVSQFFRNRHTSLCIPPFPYAIVDLPFLRTGLSVLLNMPVLKLLGDGLVARCVCWRLYPQGVPASQTCMTRLWNSVLNFFWAWVVKRAREDPGERLNWLGFRQAHKNKAPDKEIPQSMDVVNEDVCMALFLCGT